MGFFLIPGRRGNELSVVSARIVELGQEIEELDQTVQDSSGQATKAEHSIREMRESIARERLDEARAELKALMERQDGLQKDMAKKRPSALQFASRLRKSPESRIEARLPAESEASAPIDGSTATDEIITPARPQEASATPPRPGVVSQSQQAQAAATTGTGTEADGPAIPERVRLTGQRPRAWSKTAWLWTLAGVLIAVGALGTILSLMAERAVLPQVVANAQATPRVINGGPPTAPPSVPSAVGPTGEPETSPATLAAEIEDDAASPSDTDTDDLSTVEYEPEDELDTSTLESRTIFARGFSSVNLRVTPSVSGAPLRSIRVGTGVELLEGTVRAGGQTWQQVRTSDGLVGWVLASTLSP